MAEYSKYSEVSQQWHDFVVQYPELSNLDNIGIVERRRVFDTIEAALPPRKTPKDLNADLVDVQTFTIKARDGYDIPVRSYVSSTGAGIIQNPHRRPVMVYLHAGGFLFGDLESGDLNCRVLAARLNLAILNVSYRLAPKWPFPSGLNDSYDAVEWASANAEAYLRASAREGLVVGGISSGANFAAVIAYMARDSGLSPPVTGLFVSIPVGLMPQDYLSISAQWKSQLLSLEQNAENPLLTQTSLTQIQELYGSPPGDTRVSFLLNKTHSNLPARVYFQICGWDPLRDEAFLWQKLLQKYSGTKSKIHLYSGLPHGFWRFLHLKASQEWLEDTVDGIKFLCMPNEDVGFAEETEITVRGI